MDESTKIRTLIAEDEESFLTVLTSVLQPTDRFEITPCESGEEAVKALTNSSFDLVILDHKMPGKSGLNVLQWMHEEKIETPVIMLTGAGSENIAVEAMKLGAFDYVRKDQFDRKHFPILAAGVYERFLFRKDRERSQARVRLLEKHLASFASLHQSVASLTVALNSALATISVITMDCQDLAGKLSDSGEKGQLRNDLAEMRNEYATVAAVSKSIAELVRLIFDRLAEIADSEEIKEASRTRVDFADQVKNHAGSGIDHTKTKSDPS